MSVIIDAAMRPLGWWSKSTSFATEATSHVSRCRIIRVSQGSRGMRVTLLRKPYKELDYSEKSSCDTVIWPGRKKVTES